MDIPDLSTRATDLPAARVQYDDLGGIGDNKCKFREGIYKVVNQGGTEFIYKEPISPPDIKSLTNEIESLVLLTGCENIIRLHALVISANPYITDSKIPSPPVVRGILLQYAAQGSLGELLRTKSLEISWSQRMSWGYSNHLWSASNSQC